MKPTRRVAGLHPALWTLMLVTVIIGILWVTAIAFNEDFRSYARVTITSDRAGLVMEPYAPVRFHGVQVGRIASIQPSNPVKLQLELYTDQLKYIPANVGAQINAPTVFGAKYVELLAPPDPSPKRLTTGAVLKSRNVSVEANTVFQNLVGVLTQIDTAKLNSVLSALAEGLRGKG
ncbi:MAG TPA: MCE family protein, partial [Mycobacterium sp.]